MTKLKLTPDQADDIIREWLVEFLDTECISEHQEDVDSWKEMQEAAKAILKNNWHIEVDEGRCRFNCRTQREAFIAGYEWNWNYSASEDAEEAYKEWRESIKD